MIYGAIMGALCPKSKNLLRIGTGFSCHIFHHLVFLHLFFDYFLERRTAVNNPKTITAEKMTIPVNASGNMIVVFYVVNVVGGLQGIFKGFERTLVVII